MASEQRGSDVAAEEEEDWTEVRPKPRARQERRAAAGWGQAPSTPTKHPVVSPAAAWLGSSPSGPRGRREADVGRRVFVQNLTDSTTDGHLRSVFSQFGKLEECVVCKRHGQALQFGFVTFVEENDAAIALRQGCVRIDGKLCGFRLCAPKDRDLEHAGGAVEARRHVQNFLDRYEASDQVRSAMNSVDPAVALRVVRALEATQDFQYHQGIVFSELKKIAGSRLGDGLESRVEDWVSRTRLQPDAQLRVKSLLLGQRPDEIEHVLHMSRDVNFLSDLHRAPDACDFVHRCVRKFRRKQTAKDIEEFCWRFGFPQRVQDRMLELNSERALRLMMNWRPPPNATHDVLQTEFQVKLSQALKEKAVANDQKWQRKADAVASHFHIIEEWSDDEGDGDDFADFTGQSTYDRARENDKLWFAAGGEGTSASSRPSRDPPRPSKDGAAEHFLIHSVASSEKANSTQGQRPRRRQPKPTHFILCVDTSGSMLNKDCRNSKNIEITRLEAVMETCQNFVTSSAMTGQDRYSLVTFNEEAVLHMSCKSSFDAVAFLNELRVQAQRQTLYSMGIRGVEAAIRRDGSNLPAYVIFLSDGEPTDPQSYLETLQKVRKKRPKEQLKIYTIGFGESARVSATEDDFPYLQQLAALGSGHFQRCGASLESLTGAFTAVTTSITQVRSSTRRTSADQKSSSDLAGRTTAEPSRGSASGVDGTSAERQSGERFSQVLPASKVCDTIAELDGESDEVSSDDDDDYGDNSGGPHVVAGAVGGSSKASKRIAFELPSPQVIFNCKDLQDDDLWQSFQAAQTTFVFDGHTFHKRAEVQRVHLRRKPFIQGGMRLAYGMLLEKGMQNVKDSAHWMCGKRLFQDVSHENAGFHAHTAFCKSTAVATHFSKRFRNLTERMGKRCNLGFARCSLYSPVGGEGEKGYHFCGEKWLKGHFVKLNSNAGFVNEHEFGEHSEIAQAFSHFTFDKSGGQLMVVDLQGVCCGEGADLYMLLTDPQVHSRGVHERFGRGDLGEAGIRAFFQHHTCNAWCKNLQLRREQDLCDPTQVIKIPGVARCLATLRGSDSGKFFGNLKRSCRASTVLVPQEAYADWLEIKIWATQKGGRLATQRVQERLDAFYETARATEIPPANLRWPVGKWEQRLQAWQTESGARIIAWPPDWREAVGDGGGAGVQELWIFAGENDDSAQTQRFAKRQIHAALQEESTKAGNSRDPDLPASSAGAGAVAASAGAVGANVGAAGQAEQAQRGAADWTKYQDLDQRVYWYRESDGKWFYETDKRWSKFLDEVRQTHWWWDSETGEWFYEPHGRAP